MITNPTTTTSPTRKRSRNSLIPGGAPSSLTEKAHPFNAYGCEVNAITASELFARYQELGFLYPAKLEKLGPYLSTVEENWRKALQAGEDLLWFVTYRDADGHFGSVCMWRSTSTAWAAQHLVSNYPVASGMVLMASQAKVIHERKGTSHQNWFRPENKYANRIFGSAASEIGDRHYGVQAFNYLTVPRSTALPATTGLQVRPGNSALSESLFNLALRCRGRLYAETEELQDDIDLAVIDRLYQRVGLRRYRQTWLAFEPGKDQPVGAALAYRGPLGLNFSLLENRCDLLIDPGLDSERVAEVTVALLDAARSAYADFEPEFPITADDRTSRALTSVGGKVLRQYQQSIWTREGYRGMYRHYGNFFKRLFQRHERTHHQPVPTTHPDSERSRT